MAQDSISQSIFYFGWRNDALDSTLRKLALSYDGHWTGQGQALIEPIERDMQFEFSNKQRLEKFIAELHEKHPEIRVSRFTKDLL